MTYLIFTDNANSLVENIYECVGNQEDYYGREIHTWQIRNIRKRDYLVHNKRNWAEKGYIHLYANDENDIVRAEFIYWRDCAETMKAENDDIYYLGRFTELLFAHFNDDFKMAILE